MFDLQYLRRFLVVVEEMNMTRAAERLHVAQPHLSRSIRILENEIGFSLFDRSNKRRLELTAAGQAFYENTASLAAQYDEAIAAGNLVSGGMQKNFSIAYLPAAMMGVLPPIIHRFRKRYRDVRIRLVDATSIPYLGLLEEIACGRIDIACGIFPPDGSHGIARKHIRSVELRAVVPLNHPFAKRKVIHLGELAEEPFLWIPPEVYPQLHNDLVKFCEIEGYRPHIVHTDPIILNLVSLVESGLGVTVATTLTQSFVHNRNLSYLRLSGIRYDPGVELLWQDGGSAPLVTAFLLDAEAESLISVNNT